MPTRRRSVPCLVVGYLCRGATLGGAAAPASDQSPRQRAKGFLGPIAGVLAALLGAGAGCDVLWHPYIQPFAGSDGGGDLSMSPDPTVDAAMTLPATCAQASVDGTQRTGAVTLYIGNDPRKPWTAFCELVNNQPFEYLMLPNSGNNFSQYTAGGAAVGMDVRTTYSALRIDPLTLKVSCSDQRHATSVGKLDHPNSPNPISVTSMPYGVAMGCNRAANGVAQIDLNGTQFAVAQSEFLNQGATPLGNVNYGNSNRTVSLTGGGFCGWQSPKPGLNNPVNMTSGIELQLEYNPN